jgi:glycosyltransferase involved in cell wall biosynthesis
MSKKIVLFTDSYPFGRAETFVSVELEYLCRAFESVVVVPLRYGGLPEPRPIPGNAAVLGPLLPSDSRATLLAQGLLSRAPIAPMLSELVSPRASVRRIFLKKWVEAASTARAVLAHRGLRDLLRKADARTILYFYWGANAAWAAPFLETDAPIVSRFHGFDLYEERSDFGGSIPFRKLFLKRLRWAFFVSEHGLRYLSRKYPEEVPPSRVFRLGVEDAGRSRLSGDGILRITTCSRIVPLKRLDLLAEALRLVDFPVRWRHFGDGPDRRRIERLIGALPPAVTCTIAGQVPNNEVRRWYREHPCDLFLNLSETEGLPVSVIEALSASIPVAATAVGGTPELVDDSVGILLPPDIGPHNVADALRACRRDRARRRQWAAAARERWKERGRAEENYGAFTRFLAEEVR